MLFLQQLVCMKILHAKSPCCRGRIIKYGNRRRQCIACKKTWRVRKKKSGKDKKRIDKNFVLRYLNREMVSLYTQAHRQEQSERALRNRLKRSKTNFLNSTPWPKLPVATPLLAIADAMIVTLNHIQYTFYFIMVREPGSTKAIIVKPYCKLGAELANGWTAAFDQLPYVTKSSIIALICDGHRGLISVGQRNGWLIQRCHFHLLAAIQGRRSRWIRSRHRALGELIYKLAHEVLTNPDESKIVGALIRLKQIAFNTSSPTLRKILSGFVSYYEDYRTYLNHPELKLPITTNSAESLIGSVRDLCYRARGFRTLNSLTEWIEALLKNKRNITCNGYDLPTKFRS